MKFKLIHKMFYMAIGISGSGKSTTLSKVFDPDIIVEPDQIRREMTGSVSDQSKDMLVWREVLRRVLEKMDEYNLAVLDATNTKSSLRSQFLKQLPEGVHKIAIVFEPGKGTDEEIINKLHSRVQSDLQAHKERSAVPREVIARQLQQYKNGIQNIDQQFDDVQYVSS